jgi:RHS repeat-associated protein
MYLTYDGNGNTASECRDHSDPTCSINRDHYRKYNWTEDNRLASVIDGGGKSITKFVYDAAGERMVKYGAGGASITIGQFFNVKGRTAATKHVFAGTTRLASKLLPPSLWSTTGATLTSTVTSSTTTATGTNTVGDGLPNDNGCIPSDYQPQKCPINPNGEPDVPYPFQDTKVRPETYYYHPDHLGSTSWVTDQNGKVHEHVEYFPYGGIWREPKSDRDGAGVKGQRFLFSGKELDEETGLYYFGGRYYDPVRVRWESTDTLSRLTSTDSRVPLNPYQYAAWRPLDLVDPDGWAEQRPAARDPFAQPPPEVLAAPPEPSAGPSASQGSPAPGSPVSLGSSSANAPGSTAPPTPGKTRTWDIEKAVRFLNAHAEPEWTGLCAKYTSNAIDAGFSDGSTVERRTFAKDWGPGLL